MTSLHGRSASPPAFGAQFSLLFTATLYFMLGGVRDYFWSEALVLGLRVRASGVGSGVWWLGFRFSSLGSRVSGLWFWASGLP